MGIFQPTGGIAGYMLECITAKLGSALVNIFKTLHLFLGKPGQIDLSTVVLHSQPHTVLTFQICPLLPVQMTG